MAYNSGYNPDALPAHAEPEQAAQILSTRKPSVPTEPPQSKTQPQQRPYSNSTPQTYAPPQNYRPKPPPPVPTQQNTGQAPPRLSPHNSYNNSNQQQYFQNQQPYHQPPPQNQQPYSQNQQSYTQPPSQSQQQYAQNNHSYNQAPSQQQYAQPQQTYNQPPIQQQYAQSQQPYSQNPSQNHSSPQPNYGFGPPPQIHHGRSPPQSRPPPTPAPGASSSSADASLFPLFKAVDKSGTGQLTERELGKALVNGDYTSFDTHTVKMMIRMFDVDKSGSINFDEFCGLWGFLAAWRALFDRFDEDRSGHISFDEYSKALVAFGYRLSNSFVNLLYTTYDKSGGGRMSFDLFVQSCIILKRMTDVFKKYDDDRDGYITLSFEEFLTEVLRQR